MAPIGRAAALRYFGTEIRQARPHQLAKLGVARTFQNVAHFPDLTVLENVLVGRHAFAGMGAELFACGLSVPSAGAWESRQRAIAEEALDALNLGAVRHLAVETLPYGVKKKVELARALVMEPRLMLLDEPLAGMTPAEKEEIAGTIAAIRARYGLTIVMIEHDFPLVMSLANRVLVLDYGIVIAEGPPAVIRQDPNVVRAYFGTSEGVH